MFWRSFQDAEQASALTALLDKEGTTLAEVLLEKETIQEVRALNSKLLDFLSKSSNLKLLIEFIILDDAVEDEDLKYQLAYAATEALCVDATSLADAIVQDSELLGCLFSFLDRASPLPNLRAGYFSKVVGSFVSKDFSSMAAFFHSNDIMSKLISHIECYSVVDILQRIILELSESVLSAEAFEEAFGTPMFEKMLERFEKEKEDSFVHDHIAEVMVSTVTREVSRLQGFSSSFHKQRLASDPILERITKCAYAGCESMKRAAISILKASIDASTEDALPDEFNYDEVVDEDSFPAAVMVGSHFSDFVGLLQKDPSSVATTAGRIIPLGRTRLLVVELLCTVLLRGIPSVNEAAVKHGVVDELISTFFKFPMNNILHSLLSPFIHAVIEKDLGLRSTLFGGNFLDKIMHVSSSDIAAEKVLRGHAVALANMINDAAARVDDVNSAIGQGGKWSDFTVGKLAEIRSIEDIQLGGGTDGVESAKTSEDEMEEEDEDEEDDSKLTPYSFSDFRYDVDVDEEEEESEEKLFTSFEFGMGNLVSAGRSGGENAEEFNADFGGFNAGGFEASFDAVFDSEENSDEVEREDVTDSIKEEGGTEGEKEEYNDVNFWKPALPSLDDLDL
mmetsp:Transcript_50536/g.130243  ORF Transcript_50536/g.130243 Transcript_50536/m.130243 type:complete len:621 (-) Transcript_50536:384-2246(-)